VTHLALRIADHPLCNDGLLITCKGFSRCKSAKGEKPANYLIGSQDPVPQGELWTLRDPNDGAACEDCINT
jgi:hypothetical protein